jgi:ABC-2 type transport system ATP-binding protein
MYWRLSALENLAYFGTIWGEVDGKLLRKRSHELLEFFGLYDVRHERVSDFSRGMQQKMALSLALITDPGILFLDEPTLGLDVQASIDIKKLITRLAQEKGKTILLTTHQLGMAETLSDRVAILDHGRLLALDHVSNLAALWGTSWYQFVVEGEVTPSLSAELETLVLPTKHHYDENNDTTTLIFELRHNGLFYSIIEKLRLREMTTVSAAKIEPALEDVFLHLTQSPYADFTSHFYNTEETTRAGMHHDE